MQNYVIITIVISRYLYQVCYKRNTVPVVLSVTVEPIFLNFYVLCGINVVCALYSMLIVVVLRFCFTKFSSPRMNPLLTVSVTLFDSVLTLTVCDNS